MAKVAATVDLISGGRVERGIGGGWYEHEWRAYGYGFPPAGERLGRLDEGMQIFRQAWQTGRATVRNLGLAYAVLNFPEAAYDTSGIELFEREVIPACTA